MRWVVDGNNVFGSRPDGWWNDRDAATRRFAQEVAEWCRTHSDDVVVVFDAPLSPRTLELAGGNLSIVESRRRGRDAADDHIVSLVHGDDAVNGVAVEPGAGDDDDAARPGIVVVTSDRGLRRRLPDTVAVMGAGRFLEILTSAGG